MTLSSRNCLSIGEIAVYVPAFLCAVFLLIRHGYHRSGGWIYIGIFSVLRIAGGALQLLTINNPTSKTIFVAYVVILNVGLSPLLASTAGLIRRVVSEIHPPPVRPRLLRIIQFVILGGLVAAVIGGIRSGKDYAKTNQFTTETLTKVSFALAEEEKYIMSSNRNSQIAIILFIASFIALCLVTLITIPAIGPSQSPDKRLFYAVLISLPFLAVRLLYSILATFTKNSTFSPLTGSIIIYLCVAILEEFVIVVIYLICGLTVPAGKKISEPEYIDIQSSSTHYGSQYQNPPHYEARPLVS
jgi:hypothetical protein